MIPGIHDKRWEMLITGKIDHQFKSVPAGMCVARNIRKIRKENTTEQVNKSVNEVYNFFCKFEEILDDDIKTIFR